jgi:RNA recognition motif-containing protein
MEQNSNTIPSEKQNQTEQKNVSQNPNPQNSTSHSRTLSYSKDPNNNSRSHSQNKEGKYSSNYSNDRHYYQRVRYHKKTSRENSAENPGNVLYISNLPRDINDEELKEKFEKYGKIEEIKIIREPLSNDSRGFCFITFESNKIAKEIIEKFDNSEFRGNIIKIEISKRSRPYKPTPGVYLGPRNERRRFDRRDYYKRRYRSRSRSRSRNRYRSRSRSRSYRRYSRSRSWSRDRRRSGSFYKWRR